MLKKFDNAFMKFTEYVLSFSVIAMAAILIAGVIARSVFNSSLTFTEEVGQILNITVTFFAVGYCAKMARHISMSVVYDLLGIKAKKVLQFVITLGTAVIMFYLTYLAVCYVMSVKELGRVTPALRIPMWITYIPVPFGFFLGGLEYLRTFFMNIKNKDIYVSSVYKLGESSEDLGDVEEVEK